MPNYCDNDLLISGKSGVIDCLEAIRGEPDEDGPRHIDFQKIVPMPAILEGTTAGGSTDKGRVLLGDDALGQEMLTYPWVREKEIVDLEELRQHIREKYPEAEENGKRAIQAYQETGFYDWYDWHCTHWGTKWNACYFASLKKATDQRAKLGFFTAWSPPEPVIIELSKQYPKLIFTLKYWESGMGFRGVLRVKAGNVLEASYYDYKGNRGG